MTTNCTLEEGELPDEDDRKDITLWLYTTFFPVYDEFAGEPIRPRDLSDLNVTLPSDYKFDSHGLDNSGKILAHLIANPTVLQLQHKNVIIDYVIRGIARRLNTDDPTQALRMLSYFSYDLKYGFFLRRNANHPLFEGCEELEFEDLCQKSNMSSLKSPCMKYCDEMEHAAKNEGVISEMFNLAMRRANTPWPSSARNMFPECSWKTEEEACWIKRVTDAGPCYTSNYHSGMH